MRNDLYKVIKTPYLTEKVSSLIGSNNQYAFKVDINLLNPFGLDLNLHEPEGTHTLNAALLNKILN